jgi:hypothetical protein
MAYGKPGSEWEPAGKARASAMSCSASSMSSGIITRVLFVKVNFVGSEILSFAPIGSSRAAGEVTADGR